MKILWSLAAQETVAARTEYIEPVHFFLASLKFAEIEEDHIAAISHDGNTVSSVIAERDRLRELLRQYSIRIPAQSRIIRRSLRRSLGNGGYDRGDRQVIHRSADSRALCGRAEAAGRADGLSAWTPFCLVYELPHYLSGEIIDTIAGIAKTADPALSKDSELGKYGRQISRPEGEILPCGNQKGAGVITDPVCRVLAGTVLDRKKSALLIQKGSQTPVQVVEKLAGYLRSAAAPFQDRLKWIIEIDTTGNSWLTKEAGPAVREKRMRGILRESIEAGNIIIFIRNLRTCLMHETGARYADALLEYLPISPLICGTDEVGYKALLAADSRWEKQFKAVWMHDVEVPFAL